MTRTNCPRRISSKNLSLSATNSLSKQPPNTEVAAYTRGALSTVVIMPLQAFSRLSRGIAPVARQAEVSLAKSAPLIIIHPLALSPERLHLQFHFLLSSV